MPDQLEAQYVQQCRSGQPEAFEPLVRRYQNAAYAIALSYLTDEADAQDVVQDAFIAAYCRLNQLGDSAMFGRWFRRIVTNRCREWLRRRNLQTRYMRSMDASGKDLDRLAERTHADQTVRRDVRRMVETLPETQRLVTRMYYMSGMSYNDIATFLNVPVSTVKGRLQQARVALKETLAQDDLKEMAMHKIDVTDNVNRIVRQIETIFEPDVRIFAGEAFFNAAGFDYDYRKEGMLPIRKELRKKVSDRLPEGLRQRMRSFYDTHGGGQICAYSSYALVTSGPPDFTVDFDAETADPCLIELTEEFVGLSQLLSEFYDRAGIASIWDEYRDRIRAKNERNKPYVYQAFNDIIAYCRLSQDFFNRELQALHYTEDPQMCYFTASFLKIHKRMYIVQYWSEEEEGSPGCFYTALLHRVIGPLLDRHADLVRRSEALLDVSCSKGTNADAKTWPARVQQSFVRTIDRVLTGRSITWSPDEERRHVTNEYRHGRILCLYLHDALKDYEQSGESLEDYLPRLLEGIDVAHETTRWHDFWAKEEQVE